MQVPRTNLDGLVEVGSLMGVRLAIIILQISSTLLLFSHYLKVHTTDLILDSDALLSAREKGCDFIMRMIEFGCIQFSGVLQLCNCVRSFPSFIQCNGRSSAPCRIQSLEFAHASVHSKNYFITP